MGDLSPEDWLLAARPGDSAEQRAVRFLIGMMLLALPGFSWASGMQQLGEDCQVWRGRPNLDGVKGPIHGDDGRAVPDIGDTATKWILIGQLDEPFKIMRIYRTTDDRFGLKLKARKSGLMVEIVEATWIEAVFKAVRAAESSRG